MDKQGCDSNGSTSLSRRTDLVPQAASHRPSWHRFDGRLSKMGSRGRGWAESIRFLYRRADAADSSDVGSRVRIGEGAGV